MHNDSAKRSIDEIQGFLKSAGNLGFASTAREERDEWVQAVLMHHIYKKCSRPDKSVLKKYLMKMTGLSRAQAARLIAEYLRRGTLKKDRLVKSKRNCFGKIYTAEDTALLAKTDNAHERLAGPATIGIFKREFQKFNNSAYANLKNISVSHLYRLRASDRYREKVKIFTKTNPTKVPIGERRKPAPNGQPGYLCVDTVHQGDKNGAKGVYHVNITDAVTQYEYIGAVETISEMHMKKILVELLKLFPFTVFEFHSDNGSEYINKIVAELLNKLLIKQTKSRPRHTNDNGLAETKNGSIIRKHMGNIHIPRNKADIVNDFYKNIFNDYLNYHRPCAFPEIKINAQGKEMRTYPRDNYLTPYEKLKSLPAARQYLKSGITFAALDKTAYAISDTQYAEYMQNQKYKMFKNIFNNA